MTKDFSRFAPKYQGMMVPVRLHEEISTLATKRRGQISFWKTAALIGWTLALLTAFHNYVLPHLI